MKAILGQKLNMTREFREGGAAVPVTLVAADGCWVTFVRSHTGERTEIQLGKGKKRKLTKPEAGHLQGLPSLRWLRSVTMLKKEVDGFERGKQVSLSQFKIGEQVTVTGVSKGKGFAGVVKRHGFAGGPASHGHKDNLRAPGSIGAGGVQRVIKGQRMAGHMGADRVTVKNLEVVKIDEEKGILYLKGAVPGARGGLLVIKSK